MGSFQPPVGGAFQPDEIEVLKKAFDAVWETIKALRPSQVANGELRTAISAKLCELASQGIADPEELRSATLASFSLVQSNPPSSSAKSEGD